MLCPAVLQIGATLDASGRRGIHWLRVRENQEALLVVPLAEGPAGDPALGILILNTILALA